MLRRIGGYASLTDRTTGNVIAEANTFCCGHCGFHTHVKAKADPYELGGLCRVCDSLICARCVGRPCVTMEARLEAEEASYHARRSYGMI